MRKFIFAAAAVAALIAAVPASAQVFYSNDPAAGDGSEAAAVPAYGANAGIEFGYAAVGRPSGDKVVTSRGHVAAKSASKSAPQSAPQTGDYSADY